MGLEEKRKLKELRESTIPEREKELLEITGAPIHYDVIWDSLANDMEALRFFDNVACHRINMALRGICIDSVGKEAIQDGLKVIRLQNVSGKEGMAISFTDGVLEMHCAYGLKLDGSYNDGDIQRTLEAGL